MFAVGGVERVGYRGKLGEGDIVLSWESGYLGRRVVIEDALSGVFDRLFFFLPRPFQKGGRKKGRRQDQNIWDGLAIALQCYYIIAGIR